MGDKGYAFYRYDTHIHTHIYMKKLIKIQKEKSKPHVHKRTVKPQTVLVSMEPSHKCFEKDELLEIGVSGTQEA